MTQVRDPQIADERIERAIAWGWLTRRGHPNGAQRGAATTGESSSIDVIFSSVPESPSADAVREFAAERR